MPEDEVLARLLFGREAARISPWQAITIAQAVNRLRGGGSAFDVMGETRRILRVDQIEIRESDLNDGETLVSVGKYMSDRVYVELERGIQAEAGRAMVEVELTPSIRLETEIGTNAEGGLGLIWLWDY
jgi:translocation and assembly module TamB